MLSSKVHNINDNQTKFYNTYRIEKKKIDESGNEIIKYRFINAPQEYYKEALQELLYVFEEHDLFPIYNKSFAWKRNTNIIDCMQNHIGKKYLIEMDLKNFFTNITDNHLRQLFQKHNIKELDEISIEDIILFVTVAKKNQRVLGQGFPTSPYLANIVRYDFDIAIEEYLKPYDMVYTVYGDNIIISGDSYPKELFNYIYNLANKYSFYINRNKTKVSTYFNAQYALNIKVNNSIRVPKEYINDIKSDLIDIIKTEGKLTPRILGKVAFLKQIGAKNSDIIYVDKLITKIRNKNYDRS